MPRRQARKVKKPSGNPAMDALRGRYLLAQRPPTRRQRASRLEGDFFFINLKKLDIRRKK